MKDTLRILAALTLFGASQTLSIAQSDTTLPTITALSFSTSSVNVSSAAQVVILTATITDDLSGIYAAAVVFTSPSGQIVSAGMNAISGTTANFYEQAATFPLLSEAGTWAVSVIIIDAAGNTNTVSSSQLSALGLPSTMAVVDATPDVTPPTLVGASFAPTSVNTTLSTQNVAVALHVTDAGAGADFRKLVNFTVIMAPTTATATGPFQYLSGADFSLTSGTAANGTWTATKTMPLLSGATWTIVQIILYDGVTNKVTLTQSQIIAMGINPTLTVTTLLTDSTAPNLTGLTFTPSTISTTGAAATVTIVLAATDDLSGVSFALTTPNLAFIDIYFSSPSGGQIVHSSVSPSLAVGLPTLGTWTFSAAWPHYAETGTWTCWYVRVVDAVGNVRVYGASDLVAAGITSTLIVNQASTPHVITLNTNGGTVSSTRFGSRASLTMPAGAVSSPTNVSFDVLPAPTSLPTPKGFTETGTYFANISFSPALPTHSYAQANTVILPLVKPMTPGATISLFHIDQEVGLVPALDAYGMPIRGTVDPDGDSATFNNLVKFSNLVAYISNGSVLGDVNGDGLVNCADVAILKSAFGTRTGQAGFNSAADLNGDGAINVTDLFIVSRQLRTGLVCQ